MICTIKDIEDRISLRNLTLLSNDNVGGNVEAESPDEAVVNTCIQQAESFIKSKIDGKCRYEENSAILKEIEAELAIYYLYKRRFQSKVPDAIQTKFKEAEKQLNSLQSGDMTTGIKSETFFCNKTSENKRFEVKKYFNYWS